MRLEFKAGSVPDYVIVRPNGDPLYTLTNPVDDAMMDINVVLRGEDLLSSTPRQIVLYRYLIELGIAQQVPLFGHMPYVMARERRSCPSAIQSPTSSCIARTVLFAKVCLTIWPVWVGLLQLTAMSFSMDEMIENFDVRDVKANPAHFDLDKAIAINAEHIRMLEPADFLHRSVPYFV